MIKSKTFKAFVIVVGLTVLSSGMVLADVGYGIDTVPFNKENANCLYETFNNDRVVIGKGTQAGLYYIGSYPVENDETSIIQTAGGEDKRVLKTSSTIFTIVCTLCILIALGGSGIIIREYVKSRQG